MPRRRAIHPRGRPPAAAGRNSNARCRRSARCRRESPSDRAACRRRPASPSASRRKSANSSTWKAVDLRDLLDEVGMAAMMRQRMVRIGNADFGIGAHAAFAAEHHGRDARQVGLERDRLQIEHQLHVVASTRTECRTACRSAASIGSFSDAAIRISISRMPVRYSSILRRSAAPKSGIKRCACSRASGRECSCDTGRGGRGPRERGWDRPCRTAARTPIADSPRPASGVSGSFHERLLV